MKKVIFTLFAFIIISIAGNAQSLINYSATLFYNNTTNPATVQVTLYVQNTNNGNGVWVDLAAIKFLLLYNPSYFPLQLYNMFPAGTGLDAPNDSNGGAYTDATNETTVTLKSTNYTSLNITRSTNICDNILRLPPNSTTYPVFTATFSVKSSVPVNYYDFFNPASNDYPAEFQVAESPTKTKRDILFTASSAADQQGTAKSCKNGQIGLNSLNDDPGTPNTFTNTGAPLSVKWGSFNVYKQNNKAVLQWSTFTEINNAGFEIERKTKTGFEKIGFIPSKAANGNSGEPITYNFTDNLISGTTYYRILQLSFDKNKSYSEIKSLRNNSRSIQLLIYPNPVTDGRLTVILPADAVNTELLLIDNSGRLIKNWTNLTMQNIYVGNLTKGFYLLKATDKLSGESTVQKISVQ